MLLSTTPMIRNSSACLVGRLFLAARPPLMLSPSSHCRCISTRTALHLLGLPHDHASNSLATLTTAQLRQAYFAAAKKCHPDVAQSTSSSSSSSHDDFLRLTTAYEVLSAAVAGVDDPSMISADEEADFRTACDLQLGVPAEIVEECKRSPVFRRWLAGRTDAAHTWRDFLMQNGGLAPKLPIVTASLGMDPNAVISSRLQSRRRRKRK